MSGQLQLDLNVSPSAGHVLDRIRSESRDESEKGRWFEQLFMRIALQLPEFEISEIWRWPDWPERMALTGLDGRDIGIDLVARRTTREWVAIQCKCYDERTRLRKGDIDSFLGASQQAIFRLRWIVATCPWGRVATLAIQHARPQVSQIDFREYLKVPVEEQDTERPVQKPWLLQAEAIEDVVTGLANHDRGRLVMACGTGKTFTSLRIAEEVVNDGQRILFSAPTIALVSQARREWLRHTTRPLQCVVVCSDPTAGGRHEADIRVSELECPVSTSPSEIAQSLCGDGSHTHVVFCTYQSLGRVIEAQAEYGAPDFDLAIADEAHRTTGALLDRRKSKHGKSVDFQSIHDNARLHARKRLYMTATPRIYTSRSKHRLAKRGIRVVDMVDYDVYGPELHRLPFAKAVENGILSDYRVIVLGVSRSTVTPGLRRRLEALNQSASVRNAPTTNEMTRVLGVSLAVNGVTEGSDLEKPEKLPRTIAFANRIDRSKWYASALMESQMLSATTRRMQEGKAMKVVARHLDASASALRRNQELRELSEASRDGQCRVVCNVKLFTEGVDVPSLDAVAFLDPRDSQVDVVQAVGRVMRKAPGKRFGYIIIPIVVEPDQDVVAALERNTEGYKTVGRVLRALQAHDGRLAESPASFVKTYVVDGPVSDRTAPGNPQGDGPGGAGDGPIQRQLALEEADQGIYAHVAAASGLGKPGQLVADEIADAVKHSSAVLQEEGLEAPLAAALGLTSKDSGGAKGVCTIAALMLCNACLLQRRLRDEPHMKTILSLDRVAGAGSARDSLASAWATILERDYTPVFKPGLAVLDALPEGKAVNDALRIVAECANRVADSLSELGYDHAGPLYHRILGSAKSDGAFYTRNLSAILLARLALTGDFIDWSDPSAVAKLRIMDPACGTGTLLMACLQAIKARVAESGELTKEENNALHKGIVEDILCGLDINQHGIQLAACNMTLGAPTVDYQRMNLVTMPHGPQSDGSPRAGSLDILAAAADAEDVAAIAAPERALGPLEGAQVNESKEIRFPLHDLDGIIMNPPFTDNAKRGRKFGRAALKQMQRHELEIRNRLSERDSKAGGVITTNSIRTFFTPLAEKLICSDRGGFLATVLPVTGCTGAGGLSERRFLANRFHIERVVTTHDPRKIAFSENTSIHESLLICRRTVEDPPPSANIVPTEFVSLRKMPETAEEAAEAADAIVSGLGEEWGRVTLWPAARIQDGNWTPAQWYDGALAEAALYLEGHADLVEAGLKLTLGPTGRAAQDSWKRTDQDGDANAVRVFDSVSAKVRRRMLDAPEQLVAPGGRRGHLYKRVLSGKGHLMLATRYNTVSGRLTALWSDVATFGFGWIPATGEDRSYEKALCAWWNSTAGRILLLNRRAKTLTYPKWSKSHLASLPCPDPKHAGCTALAEAWAQVCELELLPLRDGQKCPARRAIDAAAASALGIPEGQIADWRKRLAGEPTISNTRAPSPSGD